MKEFRCQHVNCVDSFETQALLDDHFSTSHTRKECPHCKKLILVSYIEQHIKDRHDTDKRVVCDLCGKVSSNAYMHASHYQVMHVVHEKLQCEICGDWYWIDVFSFTLFFGHFLFNHFFRLKHRDSMRMHMARHVQGPQTCSTCGHVSPNRKALAKHKKVHMADFKERCKCIVCGKGFRDNTKLKVNRFTSIDYALKLMLQFFNSELFTGTFLHTQWCDRCVPLRPLRQNISVRLNDV